MGTHIVWNLALLCHSYRLPVSRSMQRVVNALLFGSKVNGNPHGSIGLHIDQLVVASQQDLFFSFSCARLFFHILGGNIVLFCSLVASGTVHRIWRHSKGSHHDPCSITGPSVSCVSPGRMCLCCSIINIINRERSTQSNAQPNSSVPVASQALPATGQQEKRSL